jgi:PAS domain S-box-containing protein
MAAEERARRGKPGSVDDARRFQLLLDAVSDTAICMLDRDGRVASWNSGAERINGYRAAEIIGADFATFFIPEDRAAGKPQQALNAAAAGARHEDEGWRVRKDGTRFWAHGVLQGVRDGEGTLIGFAKVTRDMTEPRAAQQALDAAREQLLQAQKLEAIGQLTGGVAHDFNNLLAVILSGLSLIERMAGHDDKLKQLLSAVRQAAQRGQGLTRQLLAFSRRQPQLRERIDVARRLREQAALLERLLGGNIRLVADVPESLWPVEADPGQLELAVLNLCLNARDAMPGGGTLTIRARNTALHGGPGTLNGDHVAIAIGDTGVGIPPEHRARVFEPFFTTKEPGKGSGLGLSQAYGFATHVGGAIAIDSAVGKGTTVTMHLRAAEAPVVLAPEMPADSGQGTVLLVEDDLAVAELTAALLAHSGYAVRIAHSGAAAMQVLRSGDAIDAVFSDIVMPGGMDGIALGRAIRAEFPAMPVLLTTGFSTAAATGADAGVEIIAKPYDPVDVTALLARMIAQAHAAATGTPPAAG